MKHYLLLLLATCVITFSLKAQQGVGIGTSMPNGKSILELSSTTKGLLIPRMSSTDRTGITSPPQGLMVFQNNGTSSLGFWYHDGTTWQRFAKASELAGASSWMITGDDQYSIVDGNVGIGLTTGISEKLTLRGDLFIQNDTITDQAELLFQSQVGTNGGGGIIRFMEPDNTTGGLIQYRPLYNVLSISNELADDAAIHVFENENIGIGGNFITDAVSKLQIQGGNPIANLTTAHGFLMVGSTSSENLVFGNDEILARFNGTTSPLILQEDGGPVRIGSGAAADGTKLHILGGAESGLATHGYMVLGAITSTNLVMDANEIQARQNHAAATLRLQQDGGQLFVQGDALVVGSTGNVGIGDITPDEKLNVLGNALIEGNVNIDATDPTLQLLNAGVDKGFFQLSGNDVRIGTNSANDLGRFIIRTNQTDQVFVNSSGNVGIGTGSPQTKLHVSGGLRISSSGEALGIYGTNPFIQFFHNNVAKFYMQQLGNDMHFGSSTGNGTGRLFMGAAEVAINTSGPAPGYSLSVGGEIICEELRVELQGNGPWPDYVFADDYKLRTLDELKSFVAINKHLPNIPAAAQVESEGFDVGDMNRRLLEKVEELTLYIIQQQEQIDEMKKAIEGLK